MLKCFDYIISVIEVVLRQMIIIPSATDKGGQILEKNILEDSYCFFLMQKYDKLGLIKVSSRLKNS